jgi:Flp pilus assembly protein TadG
MVLIGICEMSLALCANNSLSNAARRGSRYAIVRGSGCLGMTDCGATNTQIQTYVRGLMLPGIVTANLQTTTTWYTVTMDTTVTPNTAVLTTCGTSPAGCDTPGNEVKVTATYNFPLAIPWVSTTSLSLSSTSEMAISQ